MSASHRVTPAKRAKREKVHAEPAGQARISLIVPIALREKLEEVAAVERRTLNAQATIYIERALAAVA